MRIYIYIICMHMCNMYMPNASEPKLRGRRARNGQGRPRPSESAPSLDGEGFRLAEASELRV